jgi:signal transduction histidine kinase/CheY-like chemotaxis protein/HPt (histidine-containing phosphotransfer) domain-containing protein
VAGLVVLMFVVLLVSVVSLRHDTFRGRRTTDLLTASYGAEVALGNVASSLRGALISPAGESAAVFHQSESTLAKQLGMLRGLASGARELSEVKTLNSAVDRYLVDYANPLIARAATLNEAQESAAINRGLGPIAAIRRQFSTLNDAELAERQQRRNSLAGETARTITIAAIGLAGSVLLLALLGGYMLRGILRPIRRVAEELERWGEGELSGRVSEEGRGEVAMLGRSFNSMADQLERRTTELSGANRQLEHAVAQAEEASRMKSDFLANMSHEIRTPLNGVVGMVTLLSGTPLSEEQREYVEMARLSSDTLIGVVSDILDVSKIEAGRLELEQQDFDLHELITASRDVLAHEAEAKGLELRAGIGEGVPNAVRGDRLRVGQVLGNLLANAVKFTADGEVSLEVSAVERTNVATVVRFAVRDTGIGIAADRLTTLFDPFTQADVSTTRSYGGTGLGLTICRDLARLMGGTIGARSELGKGSVFEVSIPFAPAVGELLASSPAVELRGLRVLVVDDNIANRRILEAYVASWGMRATSARDAGQALSQLLSAADDGEPFDVALLDLKMPGENGIELARRINGSPRLRGTRLILVSSADEERAELEADGVRQRLTKPISQSSLLDAIAAAMHGALAHADAALAHPDPSTATAILPGGRANEQSARVAHTGRRVLIAEDNFVNRMYVERLLTRGGYEVDAAVDGRQVLTLLSQRDYDLVLMDCQMPELDGYDTTREIRRREAATGGRRIPIVAMTAAATDEIRHKCLDAGMDDYLSKPLGDGELQQSLERRLATPSASPASGVLDQDRLAHLRAMFDDEEPGTVLVRLSNEVTADLARAATMAAAGDSVGLARAAHSIRGSAQMIGAAQLAGAAMELEHNAARDGLAALEALQSLWSHTRAEIEAEVRAERRGAAGGGGVSSTSVS